MSETLGGVAVRLACVILLSALVPAPLEGQPRTVRIYAADPKPATPRAFTARNDIRMDLDVESLGIKRPFQVRAFRGRKVDLVRLGRHTPDDCLEYDTSVFTPVIRRGQVFVASTDRSWLSTTADNRYASEHWVLVFESGAPSDLRIRIARNHAHGYFSRGIEVEVRPDAAYLADRVEHEVRQNRQRYAELVSSVAAQARGCMELVESGRVAFGVYRESCAEEPRR